MRTVGGACQHGLDRMESLDDLQGRVHNVIALLECLVEYVSIAEIISP